MAQNYTYDPSQQISKSFEKTSANIGNIFTGIIEQKQRDYKLAENSFQNIEALKKNLNVFGQREITNESNQLLKEASTAIYENGKLDYNKLGEIRQKISEISDLKQGYEIGAKAFEQGIAMGNANKDNLISYTKYYNDMLSKMSDKNLVKNPQDLQRAFQKTYTDNLNLDKIFQSTLTSIQPLESVTKEVTNKKGDKIQISAKLPVGWSVDDSGKTIIPQGQAKATLDWLKQNNPDFLAQMKEKAGVGGDIAGEEGVVQYYLENMPVDRGMKTVATADELASKALDVKKKEFDVKTMGEMYNLDKQLKLSGIAKNNAKRIEALRKSGGENINMPNDLSAYGINVTDQGKSVEFGEGVKSRAVDPQTKKDIKIKAIALRTLPDGKQQVLAYPYDLSKSREMKEDFYGATPVYYDYNHPTTKNSLSMGIKNLGKDKESNIALSIGVYNRIPIRQQQQAEAPTKASAPAPATTKPSATPASESNTISNFEILGYKPKTSKVSDADFIKAFKIQNNIQ